MNLPKMVILDRDGVCNFASSNPDSPLYYITKVDDLILKPGVKEAVKLIQAHNIPIVLATKQRCVGKGLVTRARVDIINEKLRVLLGVDGWWVCVEENAENKSNLYKEILTKSSLQPHEVALFDDNPEEWKVANLMGLKYYDGTDLLASVKKLFQIV